MTTKSMAYDHPEYTVRTSLGAQLKGASAVFRFAAYTQMFLKSIQITPYTAGTSTDSVNALQVSGTVTSTQPLNAFTSGQGPANSVNVVGTLTLNQGDVLTIQKGTDATVDYGIGLEMLAVPGATITV